ELVAAPAVGAWSGCGHDERAWLDLTYGRAVCRQPVQPGLGPALALRAGWQLPRRRHGVAAHGVPGRTGPGAKPGAELRCPRRNAAWPVLPIRLRGRPRISGF